MPSFFVGSTSMTSIVNVVKYLGVIRNHRNLFVTLAVRPDPLAITTNDQLGVGCYLLLTTMDFAGSVGSFISYPGLLLTAGQ